MEIITMIMQINNETGEVIERYEVKEDEQVKIEKRRKIRRFNSAEVDINKGKSYVKTYKESMDLLSESFTGDPGVMLLSTMIKHLQFKSGMLMNKNGTVLTTAQLFSKCGISKSVGYRTFNKMEKMEMVYTNKDGIYMNPYIFSCGDRVTVELCNMFCNSKWAGVED